MNDLLSLAAHNSIAALVMALVVYGLTRVWRSPPVAHLLWLLVLLRLVAPPLVSVGWPALDVERPAVARPAAPNVTPGGSNRITGRISHGIANNVPQSDGQNGAGFRPQLAELPAAQTTRQTPAASTGGQNPQLGSRAAWLWLPTALCWLWLGGGAFCAVLIARRIARFRYLLRGALPAPARWQRLAHEVAGKLGAGRAPEVRSLECIEVPLLWFIGRRATIVVPSGLLGQLDDRQAALILAHELAHLRRRDHWVRLVELFISTIYWWNPLVWLVRRQMHRAQELCCDAWVCSAFPGSAKSYAELLLRAAESLTKDRPAARLLPASSFLNSHSLKARIEMIINGRFSPRVTWRSMFVLAIFGFAILLSFGRSKHSEALAAPDDKSASQSPDTSFLAERFKYRIKFELGQLQDNGGKIEIKEVWGTRPKIEVGGQYLVRGNYVLPKGEHAGKLYFYETAEGAWGRVATANLDLQTAAFDKPEGQFALIHSMAGPGYFHLILTDPNSYSRWFANVYFGADDNVYRPGERREKATSSHGSTSEIAPQDELLAAISPAVKVPWSYFRSHDPAGMEATQDAMISSEHTMLTTLLNAKVVKFSHAVRFEIGKTEFLDGDKITISEILGTADTFVPGNVYRIKGTYTLASRDRANIGAHTTLRKPPYGTYSNVNIQRVDVERGSGTFSVMLPMWRDGWPHVDFSANGGSFGSVYFGTGDTVYHGTPASTTTGGAASRAGNTSLSHAVRFETGATQFSDGDRITITEVHGTAATISEGNIYRIKGTYTLASHDRATLAAYTTAKDSANGYGPTLSVQSTTVDRGNGSFTLLLPMSCDGWPHVSFYPADGGNSFGGTYFGTGQSVLKK